MGSEMCIRDSHRDPLRHSRLTLFTPRPVEDETAIRLDIAQTKCLGNGVPAKLPVLKNEDEKRIQPKAKDEMKLTY